MDLLLISNPSFDWVEWPRPHLFRVYVETELSFKNDRLGMKRADKSIYNDSCIREGF